MKAKKLKNWQIGLMIIMILFFVQNPKDGTSVARVMGAITFICGFGVLLLIYLESRIKKKLKSPKSSR